MKRVITTMALTASLALGSSLAMAVEKINIGAPTWTGAKAIANLVKVVVETRIGGEANLVPGTNATIFQAMDAGKGDIDMHPDVWLPNQETFTREYVDQKGTVVLSKNHYIGRQSFCVSKKFARENDVTSIFDLARPEVAAKMDSDGNGKGEVWIGAPGWASANVNQVKVRDYGLSPFMEPVRAEQSVMLATVGDSIARNRGYAFYCYQPHAIWFMYDVVTLAEPPHDPAKYQMVQPKEDPDWFEKSRVMSEDKEKTVHIAYAKSLRKRSPAIASLLENMQLTAADISVWNYQIVGKNRAEAAVLGEWVTNNSTRVDSWLGL